MIDVINNFNVLINTYLFAMTNGQISIQVDIIGTRRLSTTAEACEAMVKNKYKYAEKYIYIFKISKTIEKHVISKAL